MKREVVTLESTQQRVTPAQWRILILLVISVWINYMDRANLSVAAPELRGLALEAVAANRDRDLGTAVFQRRATGLEW